MIPLAVLKLPTTAFYGRKNGVTVFKAAYRWTLSKKPGTEPKKGGGVPGLQPPYQTPQTRNFKNRFCRYYMKLFT
jgi:hypothetical protein